MTEGFIHVVEASIATELARISIHFDKLICHSRLSLAFSALNATLEPEENQPFLASSVIVKAC